jgi:hypothetical protein
MPRWAFLSDKILSVYSKTAEQCPVYTTISKIEQTTSIRSFVNDGDCIMINLHSNRNMIIQQPTLDAKQWELLSHHIRAKLEISKCKYVLITWDFDKHGTAKLHTEEHEQQIKSKDSEINQMQSFSEIKVSFPYKLLGINMCIDGSLHPQIESMKEKIDKMRELLSRIQINRYKANIGLQGIIYPTIKYGLEAITIPWNELDNLQAPMTHAILPFLGYNLHMPRAVAYAPIYFGGIGIQRLATERGIMHLQHLIGNM